MHYYIFQTLKSSKTKTNPKLKGLVERWNTLNNGIVSDFIKGKAMDLAKSFETDEERYQKHFKSKGY